MTHKLASARDLDENRDFQHRAVDESFISYFSRITTALDTFDSSQETMENDRGELVDL